MTDLYVRQNAWELSGDKIWHPILLDYAKAVRALQQRAATNPTSWTYQAAIHGSFAPPPPGAIWNQCQHGGWFFLPWHRLYVYYFESIVRAEVVAGGGSPDWALPYWDYEIADQAAIPPAFREPTTPDGLPNPLYVTQRAPGINDGARLPAQVTTATAALATVNFTPPPRPGFGGGETGPAQFASETGALESTPHNAVHTAVGGPGGWMSIVQLAALDPVFWLHHANIDRLWCVWLLQGGGRANPTDAGWLGEAFPFIDDQGAQVSATPAQGDTTAQLGYTYSDLPASRLAGAQAMNGPSQDSPAQLVGATSAPLVLTGPSARVDVPIDARALRDAIGGRNAPQRVELAIENIEGARNPGIVYAVHLRPRGGDALDDELTYVGTLSFFGIEGFGPGTEHPHGMQQVFDASDVAQRLRAAGRWDEEGVTVAFEALRLLPPDAGAALPPPVDAPPPVDVEPSDPVTIGRVALFYE